MTPTTALELVQATREDVANGKWAKYHYLMEQTDDRCILGNMRHQLGCEEHDDPGDAARVYWEATDAVFVAIARVYPQFVASDKEETIKSFNDSDRIQARNVLEVLDASILDIEHSMNEEAVPSGK